ncbi:MULTISPECIES: PTS 2-O-a-mannosyl-D-glycerate transporter subunit IIABC [Lacticaseibacillus]|uniref:PTS 2-O-a-mannosyl-D-glycerate transporter subunit IIABC n=2 Tax=Lacticaseibacillus TaxID=2759736 RepID=A0AAN1C691_LACCA|nr:MULTISPECIES: PTS 2-O-a-mannosyl-D-glycerate transporter subunit IIABC [Lacticaseibacillus]ARY90547.1 PTS 2-O-a-mannosyl-D-glycerate transporter subunit IIABC [Lacticaseibacillus casei]KAB1970405.1 PTS 2-O-a-mannosyl-D-glycerate transporter subunit IIABC [Lacticaseibacillus casei]WLV81165.1 PTS 2-O-a-mannosyl-D-glycerate transporter subunit IIABC [Lacticaseibacillus sp. NCIMB 15473]WNX25125.1 PTS 2-O-a-mannosyl-D-glycerate transporter subunit IIABC [Lacticaseibacillus casei]WNX27896.1 PTS 2
MDLSKATSTALISVNVDLKTKDKVFDYLINKLFDAGKISSKEKFRQAVDQREQESVTGLENGIAIPHGKSDSVNEASFAVVKTKHPVTDYVSLNPDNQVRLIFLLAIPSSEAGTTHLGILSSLATRLADEKYRKELMDAKTPEDIMKLLATAPNNQSNASSSESTDRKRSAKTFVAITACAAGIAHTYMAAEALRKAAQKRGVTMHVEEQGAKGIEDRLTNRQINDADAVILAHDVALKNLNRFSGIPIVDVPVADPIKDADAVLDKAEIASHESDRSERIELNSDEPSADNKTLWTEIKDSVMTGISYIIPIIIAGGMISAIAVMVTQIFGLQTVLADTHSGLAMIKTLGGNMLSILMVPVLSAYMSYAIADKPGLGPGFAGGLAANTINSGFLGGMLAGLMAGFLMKWMKKHIHSKGAFSGVITFWVYPVIGSLIIAVLMLFLVGQPVAFINTGLIKWLNGLAGTNAILLGAILGAMVSFDLGGPVNKAAYAFCLGSMANGNFVPYCAFASVKMVSAFSVSAACILRRDLFTKEEREIGNQTWVLGLAGITEGAIPFAMSDPIRVIGSFITGSVVTGAIVAFFAVGLDVPGAGIFSMFLLHGGVSGVMNAVIWLGAALLGAAISTFLLIVLRQQKLRKVREN